MRYDCEEDGFEGAFVEFAPSGWTRKTIRDLRTLNEGDEWFAVLRERVTALHLLTVDGESIDAPAALDAALFDRLDLVLYNWLVAVIIKALGEVGDLGNAVWRRLFATQEQATNAATPPPAS